MYMYERNCRASSTQLVVVRIQHCKQKILHDWKSYLFSSRNKTNLVECFLMEWQHPEYAPRILGLSSSVCHENNCYLLTSPDGKYVLSQLVASLSCQQQEADTRLLFHANHAMLNGATHVMVCSPDTDVLVIRCSPASLIPGHIFWQTGTKHHKRCVIITEIAARLGKRCLLCPARLPCLY